MQNALKLAALAASAAAIKIPNPFSRLEILQSSPLTGPAPIEEPLPILQIPELYLDILFVECDTKECDEGNFTVTSHLCKDYWSYTRSFDDGDYDDSDFGTVTLFTYVGDEKVYDVTLESMVMEVQPEDLDNPDYDEYCKGYDAQLNAPRVFRPEFAGQGVFSVGEAEYWEDE